jgi:hypothetical protein
MPRFRGSEARQLDFSEIMTSTFPPAFPPARPLKASLKLARRPGEFRGPDKYRMLEHRRRQAQMKARRLLDLP